MRHYQRGWLARDVFAGLVLTTMLLPAGMGYAAAAGLPPITGLYATIVPLVVYSVVGPSPLLVLGPDSGLAALIGAAVIAPAAGDPERAIALASLLALLAGSLCVVAGVLRAGLVSSLLSKPVRVGYLHGIALTVLVTQLPKLLGFSVDATDLAGGVAALARGVLDHRTNPVALAIGAGCVVIILGLRALSPRTPGILIAIVLATIVVASFDLGGQLAILGSVPGGVPLPALPATDLAAIRELFVAAIGIALVSFADTSILSRTFAARHKVRVDPDRELIGLGLANMASGLFRGFPVSASASRTPVAESAGAKTQITNLVGALALTGILIAAPRLLHDLPTTALAAVVVTAVIGMFDLRAFAVFFRVRRSDFFLAVAAFFAVAVLGVIPGIAVAVAVSILDFVRRAWRPHDAILGRVEGVKGYHDITRYPDAKQVPGLVLFRWDAPLFFANADLFRNRILDAAGAASLPQWIVVAAEPITDVDSTAAEMLEELEKELEARGVELAFAEMKDPVKDRLHRYELMTQIGKDRFFPTIGVAVKAFLANSRVSWTDWEDAEPAGER